MATASGPIATEVGPSCDNCRTHRMVRPKLTSRASAPDRPPTPRRGYACDNCPSAANASQRMWTPDGVATRANIVPIGPTPAKPCAVASSGQRFPTATASTQQSRTTSALTPLFKCAHSPGPRTSMTVTKVDISDVGLLKPHFNWSQGGSGYDARFDLNADHSHQTSSTLAE